MFTNLTVHREAAADGTIVEACDIHFHTGIDSLRGGVVDEEAT
jgi:hypothetical protein